MSEEKDEELFVNKTLRKATIILIPLIFAVSIVFVTTYMEIGELEDVDVEPSFEDLDSEEQVEELNNDYTTRLDERNYRLAVASQDSSRCENIADNETRNKCFSDTA